MVAMKYAHLLICLAVGGTATLSCANPGSTNAPAGKGPRIVCEKPVFNFGEVENTEVVKHVFVLQNAGDAPLTIKKVRPTCGCTVADLDKKLIEPGGRATLSARLSLRGRKGAQNKSIRIESDDPLTPRIRLYMKGTVITQVAVEPSYISFGRLKPDSVVTKEIKLVGRLTDVSITNAVLTPDSKHFEVVPRDDGDRRRVAVRTVPPLIPGPIREKINIMTDHPSLKLVTVQMFASVLGEVSVIPRQIVLRKSGPPSTRVILLRPGTVSSFKVLRVEPPLETVQIRVWEQKNNTYRIELLSVPSGPEFAGKVVRIFTDLENMKEIVVPIRVLD
jgi:hypothetical protein